MNYGGVMVSLLIEGIRLDEVSNTPILLLREEGGSRCLPIWIGAVEAGAIAQGLDETQPDRPLTHDLIARGLLHMVDDPPAFTITGIDEGVWLAQMQIGDTVFDARPSDLVALSQRIGVQLQCPEELIDEVGIILDADPQDEVEEFRQFLDQVSPDDFDD